MRVTFIFALYCIFSSTYALSSEGSEDVANPLKRTLNPTEGEHTPLDRQDIMRLEDNRWSAQLNDKQDEIQRLNKNLMSLHDKYEEALATLKRLKTEKADLQANNAEIHETARTKIELLTTQRALLCKALNTERQKNRSLMKQVEELKAEAAAKKHQNDTGDDTFPKNVLMATGSPTKKGGLVHTTLVMEEASK